MDRLVEQDKILVEINKFNKYFDETVTDLVNKYGILSRYGDGLTNDILETYVNQQFGYFKTVECRSGILKECKCEFNHESFDKWLDNIIKKAELCGLFIKIDKEYFMEKLDYGFDSASVEELDSYDTTGMYDSDYIGDDYYDTSDY